MEYIKQTKHNMIFGYTLKRKYYCKFQKWCSQLTISQLLFFFQNVILIFRVVSSKTQDIMIWILGGTIHTKPVLTPWCFSTRTSLASVLITHPCVSSWYEFTEIWICYVIWPYKLLLTATGSFISARPSSDFNVLMWYKWAFYGSGHIKYVVVIDTALRIALHNSLNITNVNYFSLTYLTR